MGKSKLTAANYQAIRDHIFDRLHKTGHDIKNDFPNVLRAAIETEAWKQFADFNGRPFDNLVDWLHCTYPNGASMGAGKHVITYEEALKLTEGAPDVHRVLAENAPKGKAGRPSANGGRAAAILDRKRGGKRKPVLLARLAQEHPAVYDAFQRGEYRSVRAAAEAAGLVKRVRPIDRLKSEWRKAPAEERREFQTWLKSDDAK